MTAASRAEVYARRQQLGDEAIGFAHRVETEAQARLGELLRDMPKATGGQPYQNATGSGSELVEAGRAHAVPLRCRVTNPSPPRRLHPRLRRESHRPAPTSRASVPSVPPLLPVRAPASLHHPASPTPARSLQ